MLEGIKTKELKRFVDERGFFNEVFRKEWTDFFENDIAQSNMSITYPDTVRAWHRHERGQVDYFYVVKGTIKLCAYDDTTKELDEFLLSSEQPKIVRIPGKFWHGFKSVGIEPIILIYFVNRSYDSKNPDEIRRPWNDSKIIPASINGNTADERVGKVWDWFRVSFK